MIYQSLAKVFLICSAEAQCRPGEGRDPSPAVPDVFGNGRPEMNAPAVYYVYILASRRYGTLYIGICSDVCNRLSLHRSGRGSKFVAKYGVTRLMETYASPSEAIARERALKEWRRDWKIRLIEQENPGLDRSLGCSLTAVVMGPGLRRDDTVYAAQV
jgi:putative endonuclease